MDSSTVLFIGAVAVAFIFLKWMVSPIPQQNEFNIDHLSQDQSTGSTTSSNAHQNRDTHSISTQSHRNSRRAVSESMIEVVQSIAPMLTVEQIRYDLETTGNMEATVNRFMELGDLPFPPGYVRPQQPPTPSEEPKKQEVIGKRSVNLLEKYNIDAKNPKSDHNSLLHQRRQEMILGARKRLAAQLSNEL